MTTPQASPNKSQNWSCFLWGCLIVLVLICLVFACLVSVIGLAISGIDPLGLDITDRIENIVPWQEFLEDPSSVPDLPESFFDEEDSDSEIVTVEPLPTSEAVLDLGEIPPLVSYSAIDFYASFMYPDGWDIEEEEYRVTFYDPNSYNYLYVGEDQVDVGSTAVQISSEVIATLETEAEEGTLVVFENAPYYLSGEDDVYLNAYEWTDLDGYYYWAYDLEIVSGDSNIFFFLVGEERDEFIGNRMLIEAIADSFSR